ncbi:MAG TPA: Ku protein [Acidimicrobiia bacterium]|nr:Ku protein [Acidimicrobiia bacterium]
MPRPIWKGAVSFGLVTIPVGLYTATDNKRPSFKQLRKGDHSRIRYKRVAEADGNEVEWDDIVKGYEIEKDRYVVFSDEELEQAMTKKGSGIVDVVQFVPLEEIDPIYYRQSYYLAPEKTGLKAYRILLRALEERGVIALARVAIREREYPATLRPEEGVLILETMYWPDEIREPEFESLADEIDVREDEVAMAGMLIDNMTRGFDPTEWVDESREAVEELARRKSEGEEIVVPDQAEQPAGVVDLMEALKASVEATKAKRAAG